MITVVLADDHAMVRLGLQQLLDGADEIEVVGAAADGAAAISMVLERRPHVVLMDLQMPGVDGVEATRQIVASDVGSQVVILTSFSDSERIVAALDAGAIGYLLKDTESDELRRAIKVAAAGQVQLSPQAAARLMREVRAPESPEVLTEREIEVLRMLAQGQSNKEIARSLVIGEKTVKTHVSSILGKLGVPSRTQAALYAVRIGLVTVDGHSV